MGRASGQKPIEADNQIREVRHKMPQVAQTRLRIALNRLTPKDDPAVIEEIAAVLDELGLLGPPQEKMSASRSPECPSFQSRSST
jgi:hypothetical protein